MVNSTWSKAAQSTKAGAPVEKIETTEPVEIALSDVTVANKEEGDSITLTVADTSYVFDLDTAEGIVALLNDVNPNVSGSGA